MLSKSTTSELQSILGNEKNVSVLQIVYRFLGAAIAIATTIFFGKALLEDENWVASAIGGVITSMGILAAIAWLMILVIIATLKTDY